MIQLTNAVNRFGKIILNELYDNKIECWVAGGAVRDYFMGNISNNTDYDLFFPNHEMYSNANYFFESQTDAVKIWESENGTKFKYNGKTYDLVKKYFPSPQSTIDNFDFTVSMFAVNADKVYYGESSFIDLAKRQLMINKLLFPVSSLSRAFRYYKKGFVMCSGEMAKLVEAIQNTPSITDDLNNPDFPPSGIFGGID